MTIQSQIYKLSGTQSTYQMLSIMSLLFLVFSISLALKSLFLGGVRALRRIRGFPRAALAHGQPGNGWWALLLPP